MITFAQKILTVVVLALACITVHAEIPTTIIPAPAKAEMQPGNFQLRPVSRLLADPDFRETSFQRPADCRGR